MGTVKGQFIYACVIIVPLDHGSNKVFIECKPELDEPLGHVKESCAVCPLFSSQMDPYQHNQLDTQANNICTLSTGAENRLRPQPCGRGPAASPSLQPGGTDPKVAGVRQGALLLQLARAPQADQENQVRDNSTKSLIGVGH